ncbi:MAG: catalase [Moraxellaceae bacterium]|nr:catalase [Moraxellaceae bacterium]
MLKKVIFTLSAITALTSLSACSSKQVSEQAMINEMTSILQNKMAKDYQQGNIKRDAHPKALGLLKAEFSVLKNIPKELQTPIFQAGKTYNSLIRISNASGSVQSDKEKDFRGFAIKLIGVEGERFATEQQTQDFLLMSNETMPLGTVPLFRDAVYYSIKSNMALGGLKFLFTGNLGKLIALTKSNNDTSPLDITYWSTTPYQFGNTQVKYKLVPTSTIKSKLPSPLTDSYLTDNMANHLQKDKATFDFYVQKFIDEEKTPIEDASIAWQSPFIKVATVTIPKQNINSKERFQLAENLSFSPANAINEHKALGGLNRARTAIYQSISNYRHQRNNQPLIEPTLVQFNEIK